MRKENAKPMYLHKTSKEHFIFWKGKYGKIYFYYSLSIKNEKGNNHEVLNSI